MQIRRTLLTALVVGVTAGAVWRLAQKLRAQPCPTVLAWWLESPIVDRLAGTTATLDRIGLRPGQRVLEIGPGPGRLLIPAARRVLPGGSATGLELQAGMVERLCRRIERANLTNVTVVQGDAAEPHFPPGSFDVVYLCTVLGEINDRAAALKQAHDVLVPGGRLSITEIRFDPHFQPLEAVQTLAEAAGFRLEQVYPGLGQYTANFVKPG